METKLKSPYITDLRAFASVANFSGYKLKNNQCVKTLQFFNRFIEIKVDIQTGKIELACFVDDISESLSFDDIAYLLRDIDYLVDYRDI